ncbi:hypothetical protein LTS17_012899 [Exophiala oligosperma]
MKVFSKVIPKLRQQSAASGEHIIRMEERKTPSSTDYNLPTPQNTFSKAKRHGQCYRFPELRVNRHHLPEIQSCLNEDAASMEIRALEEYNRHLKATMRKYYQLQSISHKLLEEVRASTKRLKDAVLEFRQAHKHIEECFRKEEDLHEAEFLGSHQF